MTPEVGLVVGIGLVATAIKVVKMANISGIFLLIMGGEAIEVEEAIGAAVLSGTMVIEVVPEVAAVGGLVVGTNYYYN